MPTKKEWLKLRWENTKRLCDAVQAEHDILRDNAFGYTGNYHAAVKELGLAQRFFYEELKKEAAACTEGHTVAPDYRPADPAEKQGNLTGQVFGPWTVLGVSRDFGRKWVVVCKCGAYGILPAKAIKRSMVCIHTGK